MSLPLRECGLKYELKLMINWPICHSLCGSVDWNVPHGIKSRSVFCHSLCGSVDWNKAQRRFWSVEHVTPFVGVWIEMREKAIQYLRTKSLPLWECGLKSELDAYRLSAYASLPLWECGLKLSSWITMQSPDLVTPLVRVWIEIAWNDSDCIRCEKSLPL